MRDVDGLSAIRCWPVEFQIGEDWFQIDARPAVDWLVPIVDQDWLGIVPGLVAVDPSGNDIDDLVDTGVISTTDLINAARDAVATSSGMTWWSAFRLARIPIVDLDMSGALVIARVDPTTISLGAYLAAVYRILMTERDKGQRAKLDMELEKVPKGISAREVYDPRAAAAQFEQMFSQQKGTQ
jgi:hypothetical protein